MIGGDVDYLARVARLQFFPVVTENIGSEHDLLVFLEHLSPPARNVKTASQLMPRSWQKAASARSDAAFCGSKALASFSTAKCGGTGSALPNFLRLLGKN